MDKRQKKFYKEMSKGIKQYERYSGRDYDHYGKVNTKTEQFVQEKQKSRGFSNFIIGFIKFVLMSALTGIVARIVMLFFN